MRSLRYPADITSHSPAVVLRRHNRVGYTLIQWVIQVELSADKAIHSQACAE